MRAAIVCAGLTLGLAACSPNRPPPQRVALECPPNQGELARTSAAADGRTCDYRTASGDEVSLRLIPVATTPEAALTPIEQSLDAEAHGPAPGAAAKVSDDGAAATAKATADGEEVRGAPGDHVRVDLPGLHVSADDGGANVKVGGVSVDADGESGTAAVRTARDVRLRGEAFSREKRGYRASYVFAKGDLPDGLKAVGYEAGGPRTGPLAVAVIKSRGDDHDRLYHDATALVRKNGGV